MNDAFDLPAPPMLCRIGVGLLGVLIAVSALPWAYYSLNHFGGFDWGLMGFEIITILAGVYAILLAMGKFRSGWAIGVTAISGAVLVALVFGLYVGFIMAKQTDFPSLAPLAKYTLLGRLAAIAGFFLFASIAVFVRNNASYPFIIKSVLCVAPVIAAFALMRLNIGPGAWINNALKAPAGTGATSAVLSITLGLFFIILISAAGHLLIRAYECGRPERLDNQS
jgi:xanthosine utilization system XapX-like protein